MNLITHIIRTKINTIPVRETVLNQCKLDVRGIVGNTVYNPVEIAVSSVYEPVYWGLLESKIFDIP